MVSHTSVVQRLSLDDLQLLWPRPPHARSSFQRASNPEITGLMRDICGNLRAFTKVGFDGTASQIRIITLSLVGIIVDHCVQYQRLLAGVTIRWVSYFLIDSNQESPRNEGNEIWWLSTKYTKCPRARKKSYTIYWNWNSVDVGE